MSTSCTSGSLAIEIADHLSFFCICYDPILNPFPEFNEFRYFKHFDSEKLKSDLNQGNWGSMYKCNEANERFAKFLHIFNKVSNKHAPPKKAKIKHKAYKP